MADTATKTDFGALLSDYFAQMPEVGDLIKGRIISIDKGEVRIDVNGLVVGVVRGPELFSESKEFSDVNVDDDVEATVIELENESGEMELSFRVAGHEIVWKRMEKIRDEASPIEAKVLQANKGGLLMKVDGLHGFLPVSQLSPDNYPRVPGGDKNRILEHLRGFIGKNLRVTVLDATKDTEKLILSEKALWEDEQKAVLDQYKIGDTIEGEVAALTGFGAFVKFGEGLEGLAHISEIVWQRIDHPRDVLKVGDSVKAQIIDLNKSKIYLSLKRLVEDPWKHVKDKYSVGQKLEGEIHKIEAFGLMVKLDDDIHGLAHISDLTGKRLSDPRDFLSAFKIGEKHAFEIISMEPAEHRLGLKLVGSNAGKSKETPAETEVEVPVAEEKPEESNQPQTSEDSEEVVA